MLLGKGSQLAPNPRRALQVPIYALSAQERRILAYLAEGLTNRQIGEQMYLAEKTVKNYASSMFAKLGLTSRTQAAIFAAKHAK